MGRRFTRAIGDGEAVGVGCRTGRVSLSKPCATKNAQTSPAGSRRSAIEHHSLHDQPPARKTLEARATADAKPRPSAIEAAYLDQYQPTTSPSPSHSSS